MIFCKILILSLVSVPVSFAEVGGDRSQKQSAATMLNQLGGSEEAIRNQFGTNEMRQAAAVQNRFFKKKNRHQLSLIAGQMLSGEPYLNVNQVGGSYTYYFNEFVGVSAGYIQRFRTLNENYNNVILEASVSPEIVPPKYSYGLDLVWVPIYAKMNIIDRQVFRLEVLVEAGPHQFATSRETHLAGHFGTGIRLLPWRDLSLEIMGSDFLYREVRRGGPRWRNVVNLDVRVSYWLGANE